MSLAGAVVKTASLSPNEIDQLYALMQRYFSGVQHDAFLRDLTEKPWVITLRNTETGLLQGFSTLCLMDEVVQGIRVRAFFSGDTIIDRPYWGSLELERTWFHFLYAHIDAEPEPHFRWYWFLICKGYRTYRYLPVYFHRYYPSPEPMPPFEQAVLDTLATRRFGDAYDPATGIIRCRHDYHLREGIGDISDHERRDPRIAFFEQRNPGWRQGDELACLTDLCHPNLKRCAFRMLGKAPLG
jgi:hypothetical protein